MLKRNREGQEKQSNSSHQGPRKTRCTHGLCCLSIHVRNRRMFAGSAPQPSPHFHHQRTTSGCGFWRGSHNAHGWDHFRHGPRQRRGSTRCLHHQMYYWASAPWGILPGMKASYTGQAAQCTWNALGGSPICGEPSWSSFSSVLLANWNGTKYWSSAATKNLNQDDGPFCKVATTCNFVKIYTIDWIRTKVWEAKVTNGQGFTQLRCCKDIPKRGVHQIEWQWPVKLIAEKDNLRETWWCSYLQHLSQKNLSSAFRVSVEQKFFRQLVIELFCSMSTLRSRNVSSLAVTVSHLKHLVSFVSMPCKVCVHLNDGKLNLEDKTQGIF